MDYHVFRNAPSDMSSDPHGAIAMYLRTLLQPSKDRDRYRRDLVSIFKGDPPGLGLSIEIANLTGYFDLEWMPEYGIEPFEAGEAYVAGWEGYVYYDEVMYSRNETCGWMAVAIRQFVADFPERREELRQVQSQLYDPSSCMEEVKSKLDGVVPWRYGPVGKHSGKNDIARWHASHRSGNKRTYLSV